MSPAQHPIAIFIWWSMNRITLILLNSGVILTKHIYRWQSSIRYSPFSESFDTALHFTVYFCIGVYERKHYKMWFKMTDMYSIRGICERCGDDASTQRKQKWKQEELICQGNVLVLEHTKSPIHQEVIIFVEKNVKCTKPASSNRKRLLRQRLVSFWCQKTSSALLTVYKGVMIKAVLMFSLLSVDNGCTSTVILIWCSSWDAVFNKGIHTLLRGINMIPMCMCVLMGSGWLVVNGTYGFTVPSLQIYIYIYTYIFM